MADKPSLRFISLVLATRGFVSKREFEELCVDATAGAASRDLMRRLNEHVQQVDARVEEVSLQVHRAGERADQFVVLCGSEAAPP